MNTNEGMRRIRLLAKRIMVFGSLAGITVWVLFGILMSVPNGGAMEGRSGWPGLFELFFLIGVPLACGGILWVIAWVVEGFLTSSEK